MNTQQSSSQSRFTHHIKKFFTGQEFRFLMAGAFNTAFGYMAFVTATLLWGALIGPVTSLIVAAIPSTAVAFMVQRLFVWKSNNHIGREATRFILATAMQVAVNAGLLALLVNTWQWPRIAAQTVITIVLVVVVYFLHKYWTFRRRSRHGANGTGNS